MSRLWVLLLVVAAPSSAQELDGGARATAQPLSVEQRVDPPQVQVGEPFAWHITLGHAKDERYELLTPKDLGDFQLVSQDRSRKDKEGQATTTFDLRLQLFDLGEKKLPDLTFEAVQGQERKLFTLQGPKVTGVTSLPKDADQKGEALYDIKGPRQEPVRSFALIYWALGILAALALGLFAFRALRRRAARPKPAPPPLPLEVRTHQALEALAKERLPEQGKGKAFHFRLSEIVRGYLGERYGFDALESTRTELLAQLDRQGFHALPREALVAFLDESDLIKFAEAPTDPAACDRALAFAHRLVELTKPPPVLPDAAPQQLP